MNAKAKWIGIEELAVVMAVLGYTSNAIHKAGRAIRNIIRCGGSIEREFKLNSKSIRVYINHPSGNYDMIAIYHPDNGFYPKRYEVGLCNKADYATSYRKSKGRIRNVEPLEIK
jgi:hypothetical protein